MKDIIMKPFLSFLLILLYAVWLLGWIFSGLIIFGIVLWVLHAVGFVPLNQISESYFGFSSSVFSSLITLIGLMVGLGFSLVLVLVTQYLRGICRSLRQGDPFIPRNARRLRGIWVSILVFEVVRYGAHFVVSWAIQQGYFSAQVTGLSFALSPWIAILALMVLAEVFEEGTRLRQEQKWTI